MYWKRYDSFFLKDLCETEWEKNTVTDVTSRSEEVQSQSRNTAALSEKQMAAWRCRAEQNRLKESARREQSISCKINTINSKNTPYSSGFRYMLPNIQEIEHFILGFLHKENN